MVKGQKYHMLYKTTCTVTGNFYIGVHSTLDMDDDYLGSGMRLGNSIQKHGRENHVREILEFFETREDLMKREREVVNEEMLNDSLCMNLKLGGEGGFRDEEHAKIFLECSLKSREEKWLNDPIFQERMRKNLSDAVKEAHRSGKRKAPSWKGKKLSKGHRASISKALSIAQKGEKNSQYGKSWITKDEKSILVRKEEVQAYLNAGWRKGRHSPMP